LPKVRREICSNPVSLGSFSETRHLVDPAILEQVFESLSEEVRTRHGASMGMASCEDVEKQLDEMASAQARAEKRSLAREKLFRGA
jgi:hypothetical protein